MRIVAATNHDLAAGVREGRFRKDLYYRLNIARVELCPLCERRTDLDELVAYFIGRLQTEYATAVKGVSAAVRRLFMRYSWPGNVRELKNVLESAMLQADGGLIDMQHLPAYVTAEMRAPQALSERDMLLNTLTQTNWNKSAAAQRLHLVAHDAVPQARQVSAPGDAAARRTLNQRLLPSSMCAVV